jgi:hypothetical protein
MGEVGLGVVEKRFEAIPYGILHGTSAIEPLSVGDLVAPPMIVFACFVVFCRGLLAIFLFLFFFAVGNRQELFFCAPFLRREMPFELCGSGVYPKLLVFFVVVESLARSQFILG